jgi:phosphoribosylamine---glycine ligase
MSDSVKKRFLVIGQGGREHAICHKLVSSPLVTKPVYCWPAHPWLKNVDGIEVLTASLDEIFEDPCFDAVIIGPEKYLEDGLADRMEQLGIPCFGPKKIPAQLETSKSFAKEFMVQAGIPTARFATFDNPASARENAYTYLPNKVVIKASSLAAGKGVFICEDKTQIDEALHCVFGELASKEVVIEEFLQGKESSFFVGLGFDPKKNRNRVSPMGFVADYKRLSDGNLGPNTGGMGGYTPLDWLPQGAETKVMTQVVKPLLKELEKRTLDYIGFLYVGLMWVNNTPMVIEFNARLGDPEAQILALAHTGDWAEFVLYHVGLVDKLSPAILNPTVGVVMTGEHYPKSSPASTSYELNAVLNEDVDAKVFVAGSVLKDGRVHSVSGRCVSVVANGADLISAKNLAYESVAQLHKHAPSWHYRRDIAADAINDGN